MLRECKVIEQEIQDKLRELIPLVKGLQDYAVQNIKNPMELADIALTCREVEQDIDGFVKELHILSSICAQNVCTILLMYNQDKIQTLSCTVSPNPRLWYKIPHKREANQEKWDQIMDAIGVSPLANMKDLVRIHPPGLMDYCTELIGEGGKPVAGIDPKECTATEHRLRITKRRSG